MSGNKITSRMLERSMRIMHRRSMPMPRPPAGGIAHAAPGQSGATRSLPSSTYNVEDRGIFGAPEARKGGGAIFHAADAMKEYLDMGDAPSCHTCGAIMVRNGSCYRCMSCGSTSGCS